MADLKPGLAARVSICNHKSKICNRFSIAPTVGLKSDAVESTVVLRHERHLVQRCRFKLHGEYGVPILLVRLSGGFANLRDRVAPSFGDHHKPATGAGTVVVGGERNGYAFVLQVVTKRSVGRRHGDDHVSGAQLSFEPD